MNKPVFKAVDNKGKILIPQFLRQFLDIEKGDTVSLTAENGKLVIKKAIVTDDKQAQKPKCYYTQVVNGMPEGVEPLDQLKLIAKLIQDMEKPA